jgi:hypothetical protein
LNIRQLEVFVLPQSAIFFASQCNVWINFLGYKARNSVYSLKIFRISKADNFFNLILKTSKWGRGNGANPKIIAILETTVNKDLHFV